MKTNIFHDTDTVYESSKKEIFGEFEILSKITSGEYVRIGSVRWHLRCSLSIG